jgi:hypothetical protein
VLLLALWVRSCTTCDHIFIPVPGSLCLSLGSGPGEVGGGISSPSPSRFEWDTHNLDTLRGMALPEYRKYYEGLWGRFGYLHDSGPTVILPDWFLIIIFAALSAAAWLGWSNRFSLRTLLITTTLIAVLLGLVVWSINS